MKKNLLLPFNTQTIFLHPRSIFPMKSFIAAIFFLSVVMGSFTLTVVEVKAEATELTYADLVERLYDMEILATPPAPGEKSGCFSSWDRGARYDVGQSKYVDWHANGDGGGFLDRQGTMMKMDGPGVIWRIWSAMPQQGHLRIFVDGAETPALDQPFASLFDTSKPPFDFPELVHVKARGHNTFVPIPFLKSIRIVGGKGWGKYYQITYTKFPEGTTVPSFTGTFSESDREVLRKANDVWGKCGPQLFVTDTAKATVAEVTLAPGEQKDIASFTSPGAITSVVMDRPHMEREASIDILRQLTISIVWDGESQPSVWSPLGDFFGTAAGENLYRTLATGMTEEGYYANWYMPYRSARMTVRNDSPEPRTLRFTIHTGPVEVDASNLLRYHCKWHRDEFSGFDRKQLETDRWPDWPVLKVDGAAGRFCGFQAHMWNPNHNWNGESKKYAKPLPKGEAFQPGGRWHQFYLGGPAKNYWWGEGDEKFFVDGEKMPSTFGTGTEDYFGYAWGTPTAYDSALQAQPRNGASDEIGKVVDRAGPGNIGHITMVRHQIADNVPFQQSFEATVEKYHPNEWPLLNAYTASWYQSPGTRDYYGVVPASERTGYYIDATRKAPKKPVDGKYEGEDLHVVLKGSGRTWVQNMRPFKDGQWSGGHHLIWTKGRKGDSIEMEFEVEKGGRQELFVVLTKARDYGVAQLALDGKNVGNPIDCYSPTVTNTDEISLGTSDLDAGRHVLRATIVGANEKAKNAIGAGSHIFAIDYLRVQMASDD